jgi:hypothetical protein
MPYWRNVTRRACAERYSATGLHSKKHLLANRATGGKEASGRPRRRVAAACEAGGRSGLAVLGSASTLTEGRAPVFTPDRRDAGPTEAGSHPTGETPVPLRPVHTLTGETPVPLRRSRSRAKWGGNGPK